MDKIIIKNQEQIDNLPDKFNEFTRIIINCENRIIIKKAWGNSNVVAWENSNVVARGNSNVEARGNSNVVARENSNVEARENSNVEAWGNSNVVAWGNSNVVARENSNVVAWGNSNVVAWGNSNVVAWENSNVEAWENSNVVARGNSNVVARGSVSVHIKSSCSLILLFGFSVAIISKRMFTKKNIKKKSKNSYIQITKNLGWFEANGIKQTKTVILFKKVSKDYKTQEGIENETFWKIGTKVTHKNWKPERQECGEGKFHAVSRPYFADEFRSKRGDKYIAIKIALVDTHEWENPTYPHKIAFREGRVLYECDKFGRKI